MVDSADLYRTVRLIRRFEQRAIGLMPILSYLRALNQALSAEMERDPAVCVFGEDIRVAVSHVTTRLLEQGG
jgi:hypothetical protein